jgi:hypothetical protein
VLADILLEARRCKGSGRRWGSETFLLDLWRSALDLDGWWLQVEWLGLVELARELRVASRFAVLGGRLRVDVSRVAWWRTPAAGSRGEGSEAGSVGCGL